MSDNDRFFAEAMDIVADLVEWIPGIDSMVGEVLIGPIPKSSAVAVYDLADAWGTAAGSLAESYETALHAADGILQNWAGDGAAMQFHQAWTDYLQSLGQMVGTLGSMQQGVQSFGLQIELMKFMALLGLIMLIVSLILLIVAAIPTGGLSLGGAAGAVATFRGALAAAAAAVRSAISAITIRAAVRAVNLAVARAVPTVVRAASPSVLRVTVPTFARTVLPRVVAAIPRGAAGRQAMGTAVTNVIRQTGGSLARNMLPRNVIARTVADRMAGQWLRQATNRAVQRELQRQLGHGARLMAGRGLLATRAQLVKEFEKQLLTRFGARAGAEAVGSAGVRLAANETFEQISRRTVNQYVAREIAEVSFSRELAKYVGARVALGAGFMGGGNMLGQLMQIAQGTRTGLDVGQIVTGTVQGGLFGAAMFGGLPGQVVGGSTAGGLIGGGTALLTGADWTEVRDQALLGARDGAIEGLYNGMQTHLELAHPKGGLRIGQEALALPREVGIVDRNTGVQLRFNDKGVQFARVDADGVRVESGAIDRKGNLVDLDGPEAPGPTRTEPADRSGPPGVPQLPPAEAPRGTGDGGARGGGDPVPRQGGPRPPELARPTEPDAGTPDRSQSGTKPPTDPTDPTPGRAEPDPTPGRPDADPASDRSENRTAPGRPDPESATGPTRGGSHVDGAAPESAPARAGADAPDADRRPVEPADTGNALTGRIVEPDAIPADAQRAPFQLVPAEPTALGPVAPLPELVADRIDTHVGGLLDGRGPDAPDQPYQATWHPESRTMTVRYPDGLRVEVAVQVNSALPAGQPVVVRPAMAMVDGQWVQAGPAGIVLPAHLPTDPVARLTVVDEQFGNGWRALHQEMHAILDRPPAEPTGRPGPVTGERLSLTQLTEPGDVPVLGADQVTFRDAQAPVQAAPPPITPDIVRANLADRTRSEQLVRWTGEHLTVTGPDGSVRPKSPAEIESTLRLLQEEAARLTTPEPAPATATTPADGPARDASGTRLEELTPSVNFPERLTRYGTDLPGQVHELVDRATARLRENYPEHVVAARIADLDAVAAQADRLQAVADRTRGVADLPALVTEVRELSRSVNEYGDRYSGWRDFDRDGQPADPGWRDLHGVDPLNSVEMAHRAVSIDPNTHRFHAIDQAVMVAKIGDVLGAGFETHAIASLDRLVPKTPESARALVPEHVLDDRLRNWIAGDARGGFMPEAGLMFVDPAAGGAPRSISAVAATLVHEGMHLLQPNSALLGEAVRAAAATMPGGRAMVGPALTNIRLESELAAFSVQQKFLRGLAGHHALGDLSTDPRLPASDDYRNLAGSRPGELEGRVREDYRIGDSDEPGRPLVDRHPELTVDATVARADTAIANSIHPVAGERLQGTLYGPITARVVEQFGVDLAAIQRQQTDQGWPPMRDDGTAARPAEAVSRPVDNSRVEPAPDRAGPVQEERPRTPPTHVAAPIDGTGFVPDGRPGYVWDVTVAELHDATHRLSPDDFAGSVAWVRPEGALVRVQGTDGRPHYFQPEVGRNLPNVAETTVRTGTVDDPHRIVVNDRVATEQLTRAWVQAITETMQERAATAERTQPQGVVRRAFSRLGAMFGRPDPTTMAHPDPVARPAPAAESGGRPAYDPHTQARLGERRFLLRELNGSWHPEEQARLRQEIAGVDRELARLGQPLSELDPVPDVGPASMALPDAIGAGPRPSVEPTNDGVWTDPAWQRDGRRPSIDELLPTTDAEATRWSDTVRRTVADLFDGREFAGMRLRLDLTDEHSVSVYRNDVTMRADIVDPEHGLVGRVVRVFHRDHDGTLYVEHTSLKLSETVQGRGFASAFNRHLEQWYHYSGVDRIEIHASSTVGGYAWSRAGYDWAPNTEHRANAVLDRLRAELRDLDGDLDQLGRWAAGDGTVDVDGLRQRYHGAGPDELAADARRQRDAGQQILDRAAGHRFDTDGYPTPFDISQAGWRDEAGRDASWIGKRALLGADWKGVKPIADGGPRFARDTADDGPAVRAEAGLPTWPITAAEVPDSQFHGHLRDTADPDTVGRAGRDALDQLRHRLPAGDPLRAVPIEVTTVPAEQLPGRAVARSVPVDAEGVELPAGRIPPEGGGYRIELSDRAGDLAVGRAVAHEVAELAAIGQRAAAGLDLSLPDALRPGEHADGASLSPHDLGRLAEVEVLAQLLDDPDTVPHARSELARLRDHLGLRPDEPGAAGRYGLIGPHLSDAGRAAIQHGGGPPPTRSLRIIAYDGGRGGDLPTRLATALGAGDDQVVVRTPGVTSHDLGPGARVSGADPIPGVTGPISPLLRLDGLPADADVLIGFGETAGIAEVRRDAYPHARIVQVVDAVPDPAHLAVLARADLIATADPELATVIRAQLAALGDARTPPVHVLGPDATAAAGLHSAIHRLGDDVARVGEATWRREISMRDVVLRLGDAGPPGPGTRVMTVCTEWWSSRGGIPTANRELTEAFGAAGTTTYARVSTVDSADLAVTSAEPATGVRVIGVDHVWGVLDAKGEPDTRALTLLPQNLPPHVDVVVGHSRFGGGVARLLVEQVYPGARYVHVLHTSPEVLDALRGNTAEGLGHAATERILMSGADVAAGVGPLLGREAGRLGSQAQAPPPTVHRIISDMPRIAGDPPPRPADRTHFEIAVQGRAGDPIKGIEFAAKLMPVLAEQGVPVRLTVRGAPDARAAVEQAAQLSELAGAEVVVKPFTRDKAALLQDLYDADLVMMPSIHEGFGLVASEAARAGVPVLVGEGTGAGLFFGDPDQVPARLGEPATVRDGITVAELRRMLLDAAGPDGAVDGAAMRRVLDEIDERRMPVWRDHVAGALGNLSEHRTRALELRDHLDAAYPPGNAAQRLIDAMRGDPPGADRAAPSPARGPDEGAARQAVPAGRGTEPAGPAAEPAGRGGGPAGQRPAPETARPTASGSSTAGSAAGRPPAGARPESVDARPGDTGRMPARDGTPPEPTVDRAGTADQPREADARDVARLLAERPDLARIVQSSPELANSLTARPLTLQHLAKYPEAVEVLATVLADIGHRGAEAVVAASTPTPEATPLSPGQLAISGAVTVSRGQVQPGFDVLRRDDDAYRGQFLDEMYRRAAVAQRELAELATRIARQGEPGGGKPGWRPGPKDRTRAEDKIREYDGDASRLTDLAGAKIEFASLDDLYQALRRLIDDPTVEIVKFKDRFRKPMGSGYRDVQMLLRMSNGHIAEFRLHLAALDLVAAWEHALFEVRRDLDAIADERSIPLTPAELAIRDGILREEQLLFWEALKSALRRGTDG